MTVLSDLVARAQAAGALRVYEAGKVPSAVVGGYLVLSLDSGSRASTRADGRSPSRVRTLSVQVLAQSHDGLMAMADLADAAFYDVTLTEVPGTPFCWRDIATQPTRDPDGGGWLYMLHTYRFQEDQ